MIAMCWLQVTTFDCWKKDNSKEGPGTATSTACTMLPECSYSKQVGNVLELNSYLAHSVCIGAKFGTIGMQRCCAL